MKKSITAILALSMLTGVMEAKPSKKKKMLLLLVPSVGLAIGGTVIGYNLSHHGANNMRPMTGCVPATDPHQCVPPNAVPKRK